jgi:hypothetical protein
MVGWNAVPLEATLFKRSLQVCFLLSLSFTAAILLRAQNAPARSAEVSQPKEPVLVYLNAHITDHVNIEMSEDRLRRLLPEIEKLRQQQPGAHVTAVVFFSGASSDALAQRNSQTHIVDFVKDYIQRGIIEAGYDGDDEPTYKTRPRVDFRAASSVEDRWKVREHAAEALLTEARDPLTGTPEAGKSGGLKRMQEVFGEAACIAGIAPTLDLAPDAVLTRSNRPKPAKHPLPTLVPELGGDSETVEVIRSMNTGAVMLGLPEDNPAMLPGFGGSLQVFGQIVSPIPGSAPEIYWQDNVLRTSEASNPSEEYEEQQKGYSGLDDIKDDFKKLDRKKMHVVHVDVADERYYLQPALTKDEKYPLVYAFGHPDSPKLPPDAVVGKVEVDKWFTKEVAALEWITTEFFPANPGSEFVSNADLRKMTEPSTGFSVPTDALRKEMNDLLSKWGNNTFLPEFVEVAGRYLSLADLFQVLTDALAEQDRTGKLPEAVQVVPVFGPNYTITGHGPNEGEVTVAAVAHYCAELSKTLHDTSPAAMPKNMIPNEVKIDGRAMNAAQLLRVMAKAIVAATPDTKIPVKMTYMAPGQAQVVPKTRAMTEIGAMWTVKPAPLTNTAVASK